MYKFLPILLFAYGLAVTTEDIYDNSYALIIGIDKYENVRSLDYAVKDAVDIQSMLVDKFNFQQDNIVLLKDEEATKASIIQEFSNITKKANDNDRVLIFFAGHGETIDLPDGGEMGFLLPVDGDKTDLYLSAIKMEELKTLSLLSDAKHILYLVDACYGGIVSVGARGLDAESTPDYLDKITQYKSRQIISAGGRGEEVIEKAEWGHSAFTKNLLSGLRDSKADRDSDGIITVQELGTYLQKKVTIDSDNRQTPKTRNLSSDEGEFVFVYSENTAVIQDKSTDAKLDAVLSKLEKLEEQSTDDKTKPDLKVNLELQQSDYPKIYSFTYGAKYLYGSVRLQLEKRAFVGIGLGHIRYEDYPKGEALDVNEIAINGLMGYYLTPRKTNIYNPFILFGISANHEKRKNETLTLNGTGTEINYFLSLNNDIILNNKVDSYTIGFQVVRAGVQLFNDDGDLYVDRYEFIFYPVVSINIIQPNITYEAISSSDKFKNLRQRKKNDLIGFSIAYISPIISHYWLTDGLTVPVLLIPAIGPFLSFSDEYNIKGYENITLFSGICQTYYLFDYIRTSKKLKGFNNNISYQINLYPIAPSVKFTYNFD